MFRVKFKGSKEEFIKASFGIYPPPPMVFDLNAVHDAAIVDGKFIVRARVLSPYIGVAPLVYNFKDIVLWEDADTMQEVITSFDDMTAVYEVIYDMSDFSYKLRKNRRDIIYEVHLDPDKCGVVVRRTPPITVPAIVNEAWMKTIREHQSKIMRR